MEEDSFYKRLQERLFNAGCDVREDQGEVQNQPVSHEVQKGKTTFCCVCTLAITIPPN